MAGKAKFDQEAAFKAIVGADRQMEATETSVAAGVKNKGRVQRSYFLDRDIDKALRRMALEEEKILRRQLIAFCVRPFVNTYKLEEKK